MAVLNPYNYKRPIGARTAQAGSEPTGSNTNLNINGQQPKLDAYLEQRVLNAKPEELTLMLYDGIIKFISQAKLYNSRKDIEKSSLSNIRSQAIIEELRATLNLDYEVAENLESLYVFMLERLVEANVKKDNVILDEVLELVTDLRDTWKKAMGL